MKIQCEIIRDLIPLIEDDVCSEESKKIVLEHIEKCEECKRIYDNLKIHPTFVLSVDEEKEKEVISKGFKKVKTRWIASIIAVLLVIPALYLSWGQIWGTGLSFTNIDELITAYEFVNDLEKGDYQASFEHMYLNEKKEEWLQNYFDEEKMKNFDEDSLKMFCDSSELLKNVGGIKNPKYLAIEDCGTSTIENRAMYGVHYSITVGDHKENLVVYVTDKGIHSFSGDGSFLDDPVAYFANWSELLWQKYEGCYWDPLKQDYIYK